MSRTVLAVAGLVALATELPAARTVRRHVIRRLVRTRQDALHQWAVRNDA